MKKIITTLAILAIFLSSFGQQLDKHYGDVLIYGNIKVLNNNTRYDSTIIPYVYVDSMNLAGTVIRYIAGDSIPNFDWVRASLDSHKSDSAVFADTSNVTFNIAGVDVIMPDTLVNKRYVDSIVFNNDSVLYAIYADTSNYSLFSDSANYADSSLYSDTSNYAFNAIDTTGTPVIDQIAFFTAPNKIGGATTLNRNSSNELHIIASDTKTGVQVSNFSSSSGMKITNTGATGNALDIMINSGTGDAFTVYQDGIYKVQINDVGDFVLMNPDSVLRVSEIGVAIFDDLTFPSGGLFKSSTDTLSTQAYVDSKIIGTSITTEILYNNSGEIDGSPMTTDGTDIVITNNLNVEDTTKTEKLVVGDGATVDSTMTIKNAIENAELDSIYTAKLKFDDGSSMTTATNGSIGSSGDVQFSDGASGFTNSNGISTGSTFNWDGNIFSILNTLGNYFTLDLSASGFLEYDIINGGDEFGIHHDQTMFSILNSGSSNFEFTIFDVGIHQDQISGSLTDGTPTAAQLTSVIGMSAATAEAGFQITVKDNDGSGLLYRVESDGTDWFYTAMTKAL